MQQMPWFHPVTELTLLFYRLNMAEGFYRGLMSGQKEGEYRDAIRHLHQRFMRHVSLIQPYVRYGVLFGLWLNTCYALSYGWGWYSGFRVSRMMFAALSQHGALLQAYDDAIVSLKGSDPNGLIPLLRQCKREIKPN